MIYRLRVINVIFFSALPSKSILLSIIHKDHNPLICLQHSLLLCALNNVSLGGRVVLILHFEGMSEISLMRNTRHILP